MPLEYVVIHNPDDKYRIKHKLVPSPPFKQLVLGASDRSGKTNKLQNYITRPFDIHDETGFDFYVNDFDVKNIYLICRQAHIDKKWIKYQKLSDIPKENVLDHYNEIEMRRLYDRLKANHLKSISDETPPVHSLVILDDIAADGSLVAKRHGAISLLVCEGRHMFISTIVTAQYLADIPPKFRTNTSAIIFHKCTAKELDIIADHFFEGHKANRQLFMREFRKATRKPYSSFVIKLGDEYPYRYGNYEIIPALMELDDPVNIKDYLSILKVTEK